ncbi:hypothetical protein [Candidatus Ichthyocystis hellenicum]|uniref:hypothetical protein n=2 Tax=Candidatus Ichthyocystis TaxID=2929841 RepID=UPI000B81C626|nr:hypothetical protein [Candidatus Ichthyocystis hellenicum]
MTYGNEERSDACSAPDESTLSASASSKAQMSCVIIVALLVCLSLLFCVVQGALHNIISDGLGSVLGGARDIMNMMAVSCFSLIVLTLVTREAIIHFTGNVE